MAKSDEKQTYLMRKTWHTTLKALTDEQLGAVMRSIICFQDGEEGEVDNPILNAIAMGYIAELKRDKESYDETCAKRAEAGARGGKQRVANQANANFASEEVANQADKDRDKDKDKEEDKDSNNKKSIEKKPRFSPPTEEQVQAYCDSTKYKINVAKFIAFYQQKNWYVGKNKMTDWQAAVRGWYLRDQEKAEPKKPVHNIEGRKYDFAALEREATGG